MKPMSFSYVIKFLGTITILILIVFSMPRCNSKLTKEILLTELQNNRNKQDWYVPLGKAIQGLSEEQAIWKDDQSNHSIKELLSHLAFWNERILSAFNQEEVAEFDGNNEITFQYYQSKNWQTAVMHMDSLQSSWEASLTQASSKKIKDWASEVASMNAHIAYHTGQIILIRKQNGWW